MLAATSGRSSRPPCSAGAGTAWPDHAGHGRRGVAEHQPGDPVDAGDVHHRVHDADVLGPDVRRHVAGGHGGDQQLGQPDRQRRHDLRRDRGTAGAPGREHPADPAPGDQVGDDRGRAAAHRGHRPAAVRGRAQLGPAGPGRRRRPPPRRCRGVSPSGSPVPASITITSTPAARSRAARNAKSGPLVSRVPTSATAAMRRYVTGSGSRRGSGGRPRLRAAAREQAAAPRWPLAGDRLVVVGAGDGVDDLGLVEVLGAFDLRHEADQHAVPHDLGFKARGAVGVPLGLAAAGQRHADAELVVPRSRCASTPRSRRASTTRRARNSSMTGT